MEPKTTQVSRILVTGLTVRTMNSAEFIPENAKIPGLWEQFSSNGLADKFPDRVADSPIFGVYSGYDSDAGGFYNVTAGVSVATLCPEFSGVEIQAGQYLVFDAIGPLPAAVIQAWASIWTYFEQHPQVKRSFLTDFEAYYSSEKVLIHIGIAS